MISNPLVVNDRRIFMCAGWRTYSAPGLCTGAQDVHKGAPLVFAGQEVKGSDRPPFRFLKFHRKKKIRRIRRWKKDYLLQNQ